MECGLSESEVEQTGTCDSEGSGSESGGGIMWTLKKDEIQISNLHSSMWILFILFCMVWMIGGCMGDPHSSMWIIFI